MKEIIQTYKKYISKFKSNKGNIRGILEESAYSLGSSAHDQNSAKQIAITKQKV